MLLPGPEAQQLATYVGWLLHGTRGGLVAGLLFVLPGFLAIMALSIAYVLWQQQPLVEGLFLGLKAAVIALVIEALLRIGKRALTSRAALWVAGLAFVALAVLRLPFPLIVLGAGVAGYLRARLGLGLVRRSAQRHPPARLGRAADHRRQRSSRRFGLPPVRSLKLLALWLPLWFAPVLRVRVVARSRQHLHAARRVLQQDGGGHVRWRVRRAEPTSRNRPWNDSPGSRPRRCSTAWGWPNRRPGR